MPTQTPNQISTQKPSTPHPQVPFPLLLCPRFVLRKDRLLAWLISTLALVLETEGDIWQGVRPSAT